MSAPDDPTRWPSAPPPLPPTLPTDVAAGPGGGWTPGPALAPPPVPPGGSGFVPAPSPGGPPPPGPPGARGGLIAAAIAAVVVLALAATFLVVQTVRSDEVAAPASSTTSAPPTTESAEPRSSTTEPDDPGGGSGSGSGTPGDVEAEVADIAAFVEEERGLSFEEPVEVTALEPDEFKARVLDEFATEQEALETESAFLRASGLVPADLDVVETQLELYGDGVGGFYDPATGELVVRADSAGPLVRSVIAHELTHALDDQHFDLDRPELAERDDGSDWAFTALAEGSARRVENAYIEQFTPEEQDQYQADLLAMGNAQVDTMLSVPLVLIQMMMSPYDYGSGFVDALLADGGQNRLDEAFGAPPTSSEQVLDPSAFDQEQPVEVATPPAEGEIISEGVLGELWTGYLIAEPTELDDLLGGVDPGSLDDMTDDLDDLQAQMDRINELMEALESGTADPAEVLEELEQIQEELETAAGGLPTDPALPDLEDLDDLGGLGSGEPLDSGFPPVETPDGWGGDRYVVWGTADQVCLRVDWVMDSPEALAGLRGDLAAWATRDPAVTVADPTPDTVRATRCALQQNP